MEISSTTPSMFKSSEPTNIKVDFTQKISNDDVQEIKDQIAQQAKDMMVQSLNVQTEMSDTLSVDAKFEKDYQEFQAFLQDVGFDSGKSLSEISQDEAKELISEDGIFGVKQTSQRIADFVISGANGDENLLRAGREGMLQGFKEAESMWQQDLPDISQQTMKEATKIVDLAMSDLGFSIIDKQA